MGDVRTSRIPRAPIVVGDTQISGSILVYGQAWNAVVGGTGRDRYVTSGELAAAAGATSPSAPVDSIQFNESGNFGGDAALRWTTAAGALTVSGATWLDGRTLMQGPVQISGGPLRVYGVDGHRLNLFNSAGTRGVLLFPTNSQPFVLTGSGFTAGSWSANSQLFTDRFTVNMPLEVVNIDGTGSFQVSGTGARFFDGAHFGDTASRGGTRITADGDVQVSGETVFFDAIAGAKTTISRTGASVSHLKLQNPNNNANDRWWIGFPHGASDADSNERARIGIHIGGGGEGKVEIWTGPNGALGEKFYFDEFGNLMAGYTSRPVTESGMVVARGAGIFARAGVVDALGANRFLTSGELTTGGATSPASPFGAVQFNNAGSFGGDADLRWDSTAMTLTVSGGGLRVESPVVFRAGAGVQASGAIRTYRNDAHHLDLQNSAGTRGVILDPSNPQPFALEGSGFTAGSWSANSQLFTDRFTVNMPFEVVNIDGTGSLQVSGTGARFYEGAQFGSTASRAGTRVTAEGDVQISGTTVVYRPLYATHQTGAARYVTSGEMAAAAVTPPASPPSSIQFNNAGAFGGEIGLRWDASADVLLVSGVIDTPAKVEITGRGGYGARFKTPEYDAGGDGYMAYVAGSGTYAGFEYHQALYPGDRIDNEINVINILSTQLSGMTRIYNQVVIGATATPRVRVSAQGDVQASGGLQVYPSTAHFVALVNPDQNRGAMFSSRCEAFGYNYFAVGSGYLGGGKLSIDAGGYPGAVVVFSTMPTVFDDASGVQLSGGAVAYRPIYARLQTGAARYITSGELSTAGATSPATPFGSVQFNNAGSFGGDADLRWDTTAMTLTVSGGGLRGEAPAVFHDGVQVSGSALIVYDRLRVMDLDGFYGLNVDPQSATGGVTYTVFGSGVVAGHVRHFKNTPNDREQWVDLPVHFSAGAQISGEARSYRTHRFGNTASLGGTQISTQGDVQVSGGLRVYDGVDVTGTLTMGGWSITGANQVIVDATVISPTVATDSLLSSTTTLINIGSNALTAAGLQISGATLAYGPLYQRAAAGTNRYLTSGELHPVISTLHTTGTETFAAGYTRTNMMVSTTLASSMLWPENGIEFDVLGTQGIGVPINFAGVVVSLGGQVLISGVATLTSGLYSHRTRGTVYALAQNGRQASSTDLQWWGPSSTAVSGGFQNVLQTRNATNHYLTLSPTVDPVLEVAYTLFSGGLGVYQTYGRTVYARVHRLPSRP